MRVGVHTTPLDPKVEVLGWAPVRDPLVWRRRERGLVAWGTAATIEVGTGPDRAARVARSIASLEVDGDPTDVRMFASLTFDRSDPRSVAVLPRHTVVHTGASATLVTLDVIGDAGGDAGGDEAVVVPGSDEAVPPRAEPEAPSLAPHGDRIRFAGSSLPDVHWLQAVADLLDLMADGAATKVVLARDHAVWSHEPFDPRVVTARLHHRFPSCWTFQVGGLVGATPELLVERRGRALRSLVLAGTTGRDPDPEVDRRLGEALLASDKDLREHRPAVRSVVEQLGTVATDVTAPDQPVLLDLDNVRHLATPVSATLDRAGSGPAPTAIELADGLHPTAAVGGTPTGRALDLIARLEGMDRGRYAAPVGWMDATGDGQFGIALRCALLSGARARLFAGAGIVRGSLPEDELTETQLKLLAMQQALQAT